MDSPGTPSRRGRPRTSSLSRSEQLRRAKRAQRLRDRAEGWGVCHLKLRRPAAERLRLARREPGFAAALEQFLGNLVIDVRDYPNLRLLCWNRAEMLLSARDAFALYERNWRLVDPSRLDARERALIERLSQTYGNGLLNV